MSLSTYFRLFTHTLLMPVLESGEETTLVGGQAVMEGVMMRAPHSYCVAVRKPSGEIVTEQMPLPRISEKYKIFKYPVLRGVGTLYQAMSLGMKALKFSADVSLEDLNREKEKKDKEKGKSNGDSKGPKKEVPGWMLTANLVLSLGMFIFMYKFIPLFVVTGLKKVYPVLEGRIPFNLADGLVRMLIFLVFMYVLSLMKDIRRVFEFHGAEHKVVFNFESGQPVTVPNAQQFTTFHPRCGTSFLFVVIIVSIVFYTFIPFRRFPGQASVAHRAVAGDRGRELRTDPLRRQAARLSAGHHDGAWPVAAAHHHQTAGRRPDRGGHPRAGRRHGARRVPGRTTGHRVITPCNSFQSSNSSKSALTSSLNKWPIRR